MGGRGASSSSTGTNKLYSDFVNNSRIVAELNRNIYARQSDDRNAKVGSTRLDSDRMISNYTDTLTTEEYSRFNVEKAENELFKKLRQLERKAGFKK